MVQINTIVDVPRTDKTINAKMSVGNAINTSTHLLKNISSRRPTVAAKNPKTIPMVKAITVVIKAIEIVFRAPYNRRV